MNESFVNSADGPFLVSESGISLGGVDPLGIRQINFDLMDMVLPGLNNTARHVRPFMVITWAWHRAKMLAEKSGQKEIRVNKLRKFVARVEVIFALSQMLDDPAVDLPGKQILSKQLQEKKFKFRGKSWKRQVEKREYSTALSAPIFYGPGLKSLGWLIPSLENRNVMVPSTSCGDAIKDFESGLNFLGDHQAFNDLGPVTVSRKNVEGWAEKWTLESVRESEAKFMLESLLGSNAPEARRRTFQLISEVMLRETSTEPEVIRKAMCRHAEFTQDGRLQSSALLWRRVQIRQVFRLALEMLFYWITLVLRDGPKTTNQLAQLFCDYSGVENPNSEDTILFDDKKTYDQCPIVLLRELQTIARSSPVPELPPTLLTAFQFVIASAPTKKELFERSDRLPLKNASDDLNAWRKYKPVGIINKIIEKWIFAQHVRSAVGRGLSDARANGKTILRIRVVLEEGGWQLAPGFTEPAIPNPTPDRLDTAISLLLECRSALEDVA